MSKLCTYMLIGVIFALFPGVSLYAQSQNQPFTATSFSYTPPTTVSNKPSIPASFTRPVQNKTTTTTRPPASTGNPNQKNLEGFISKIRQMGKDNPQIEGIISQIRVDVATTTNFTDLFLKQKGLIPTSAQVTQSDPLKEKIISFFSGFQTKQALAATTLPFGGPLLYTYFCPCSFSWLVYVGPTSNLATSNMILDYVPFSQAFLNYNIPYTTNLLGKYSPGNSICYIYYGYGCINLPITYGLITPIVGSSTY